MLVTRIYSLNKRSKLKSRVEVNYLPIFLIQMFVVDSVVGKDCTFMFQPCHCIVVQSAYLFFFFVLVSSSFSLLAGRDCVGLWCRVWEFPTRFASDIEILSTLRYEEFWSSSQPSVEFRLLNLPSGSTSWLGVGDRSWLESPSAVSPT